MGQKASKGFDLPAIPADADAETALELTMQKCSSVEDLEGALKALVDRRRDFASDLKRFDLSAVKFITSAEHLDRLSSSFGQLEAVTEVNFSNIPLGPQGGAVLARSVLPAFPEIRILKACNCGLKDEGAKAIAASLMQLQKLKTVTLTDNEISADGASALRTSLSIRNNASGSGVMTELNV